MTKTLYGSSAFFWPTLFLSAIAVLLAACGSSSSPPRQVDTDYPSVTYVYRGDEELVAANEKAMTYCNQYQAAPRTASISDESGGRKKVVFECIARAPTIVAPQPLVTSGYIYRTDQELLNASNNAANYCMSQGGQRAISTLVANPDGTRTITFQCAPR